MSEKDTEKELKSAIGLNTQKMREIIIDFSNVLKKHKCTSLDSLVMAHELVEICSGAHDQMMQLNKLKYMLKKHSGGEENASPKYVH